jgi:hypothetical protein
MGESPKRSSMTWAGRGTGWPARFGKVAPKSSTMLADGVIIVVALFLAWLTWGRWGDIQIDCGRELYVPLEILRGKLLYRDIWYPYGPLAPYLEALLVEAFGQRLLVFYLFGLAITIGCALSLYRIGSTLEQPIVGLTVAVGFLLQGFSSWHGVSPEYMNLIFPYSYAASIGLCLGLI